MNMANMANMANMGGPVGAQGQMLNNNNGALPHQGGPRQPLHLTNNMSRTQFHTYIYEYLLRTEFYDCARALYQADPSIHVKKEVDENGNGLGDDPMDTDMKELEIKRPNDLPAPLTATSGGGNGFLYDWFCIFWDIFTTSKGGKVSPQVQQYVTHNQTQSRLRQEQQQQHMLRNMQRGATEPNFAQQQQFHQQLLARGMPNGMMMKQQGNPLQRAAMANNQNPQAMMLQQKAAGMQRGPSDMDGNRGGPASPGSTDNAPSPSKRPRLDGVPAFNPNQAAMIQNGRPTQGMQGQQQGFPPNLAKNIATYAANLQQHHGSQMPNKNMANPGGPQGQGAPMVQQGGPDGAGLAQFYNPGDLAPGANMRPGPGAQAAGSNHALQDYQMQLMLLEQQNKKRLMMARQEQDVGGNTMQRPDGSGGPGGPGAAAGPGGQNFPGASPPGGRNGASPNPAEQMKRANQQMANAAMGGSPLPDGAQSRSSPNSMNFMGQNMDPNGPHFAMGMGMAGQMNGGMRPPGAHPAGGPPFNPQMATVQHQQMMAAAAAQQQRHQAQQGQGVPGMQWQPGPNGQMPGQGPAQGTPQQRPMPPPSAPAAAAAAAGSRNATSSPQTGTAAPPTPQQANKPAPKKKETKKNTGKAAAQKKGANVTTGANTAAEPEAPQEPPTPATPITPVNPPNFAKNQNLGVNAPGVPNGQPAQAVPAPVPAVQPVQHPEQNRNFNMDANGLDFSMDFANPLTSGDVLNDFDFDSFLHDSNGGDEGTFDFSAGFMEGGEIGAD